MSLPALDIEISVRRLVELHDLLYLKVIMYFFQLFLSLP